VVRPPAVVPVPVASAELDAIAETANPLAPPAIVTDTAAPPVAPAEEAEPPVAPFAVEVSLLVPAPGVNPSIDAVSPPPAPAPTAAEPAVLAPFPPLVPVAASAVLEDTVAEPGAPPSAAPALPDPPWFSAYCKGVVQI